MAGTLYIGDRVALFELSLRYMVAAHALVRIMVLVAMDLGLLADPSSSPVFLRGSVLIVLVLGA